MPNITAPGLLVSEKKIFEDFRYLTLYLTDRPWGVAIFGPGGMIYTNFVHDHLDPVCQISLFQTVWFPRRRFLKMFPILLCVKLIGPRAWPFLDEGHDLNKLGRRPFSYDACQISLLQVFWFQRRRIFKIFCFF